MQRKVFLQKSIPKGKHSYLKLSLWSAVALLVLVLVTPLFTRHKGNKEVSRKPIPEKSGVVIKEIPKSLPPVDDNLPPADMKAGLSPNAKDTDVAPVPEAHIPPTVQEPEREKEAPPLEKNIQVDVSPQKAQATSDAQQKEHAAELALAQPSFGQRVFKDTNAAGTPPPKPNAAPTVTPKDKLSPPANKTERPPLMGPGAKQKGAAAAASAQKQPNPALGDAALFSSQSSPDAGSQKKNAKKKDAKKTDSEQKSTDGSGSLFAVQVGSFKEKQNAEEMLHSLEKKGYNVVLRPVAHPKLGQLYVVQLQPVADVGKASTLMMQIKHEEKVRPVIVKVPGGQ